MAGYQESEGVVAEYVPLGKVVRLQRFEKFLQSECFAEDLGAKHC